MRRLEKPTLGGEKVTNRVCDNLPSVYHLRYAYKSHIIVLMKRVILQISMSPELRRAAEMKAESLGFSSLQEMIRVMLTQVTRGRDVRVDDICEKYGIAYLGLFGSMARGEDTAESDVDLLVRFEDQTNIGLFELDRLQRDLEIRFGRKVDLVTKLNKYIEPEAERDLKTLYEK